MSSLAQRTLAPKLEDLSAKLAELIVVENDNRAQLRELVEIEREKSAASWTIPQFCKRHSISEATFHRMRDAGRAPRLMKIGQSGVRISRASEAQWVLACEQASEADKD